LVIKITYTLGRTSPSGHNGVSVPIDCNCATVGSLPNGDIVVPDTSLVITGHKVFTLDAGIVDSTAKALNGEAAIAEIYSAIRAFYVELRAAAAALNVDSTVTNSYGAIWSRHVKLGTTATALNAETSVSKVNSAIWALYMKLRTASRTWWNCCIGTILTGGTQVLG